MGPRRDGRRGCAAGFSQASLGCPRGEPKMASGERRPPEAGCTFGAPSTWVSLVRLLPSRARPRFSRRTEITQCMHVPLASFGHPSHAPKIQGGLGDWFLRKDKKCCSAGMRTLKPDEPALHRSAWPCLIAVGYWPGNGDIISRPGASRRFSRDRATEGG